jgi:hypothetical protein
MATTSVSQPSPLVQSVGTGGAARTPKQLRIEFNAAHLARFRSAWLAALAHHKKTPESDPSRQDTARSTRIPWHEYDLRELPEEEARRWYQNFLESDRRQQLSTARAPGMRCAAILFSEDKAELIWSVQRDMSATESKRVLDEVAENYGRGILCVELNGPGEIRREAAADERDNSGISTAPTQEFPIATLSDDAKLHEIESQLLQVWSAVLRLEITKTDEDFFTAGGHSLLAAKLLARIEAETGVELPIATLLDSPTIEKQARLILAALNPTEPPFRCAGFDGKGVDDAKCGNAGICCGPGQPEFASTVHRATVRRS